jgi:hypothetical protein
MKDAVRALLDLCVDQAHQSFLRPTTSPVQLEHVFHRTFVDFLLADLAAPPIVHFVSWGRD